MPFDDTKLATQVGFLLLHLWKALDENKELHQQLPPKQEMKSNETR